VFAKRMNGMKTLEDSEVWRRENDDGIDDNIDQRVTRK